MRIEASEQPTGPEHELATQARRRNERAAAAYVFVIVDSGDRWTVDLGCSCDPIPEVQAEQFRRMLHESVDALFDTAAFIPDPAGDA